MTRLGALTALHEPANPAGRCASPAASGCRCSWLSGSRGTGGLDRERRRRRRGYDPHLLLRLDGCWQCVTGCGQVSRRSPRGLHGRGLRDRRRQRLRRRLEPRERPRASGHLSTGPTNARLRTRTRVVRAAADLVDLPWREDRGFTVGCDQGVHGRSGPGCVHRGVQPNPRCLLAGGAPTAPACVVSSVSSAVRGRLDQTPVPPQASLPSPVVPVTASREDLTPVPPYQVTSTVSVPRSLPPCWSHRDGSVGGRRLVGPKPPMPVSPRWLRTVGHSSPASPRW